MDIPSLSDGAVGSRFVTQDEIEAAKARKEEQWKAAYARLGQDPPPRQQEDYHDGRSLAEKLAANRAAKQEEWEEKTKLANQFRALEEDEIQFLDSIRERQATEERLRKKQEGEELKSFKEAVAARNSSLNGPPPLSKPTTSNPQTKPPQPLKKEMKKASLKGVVVKKKVKTPTSTPSSKNSTFTTSRAAILQNEQIKIKIDISETELAYGSGTKKTFRSEEDNGSENEEPSTKRRKVSPSPQATHSV